MVRVLDDAAGQQRVTDAIAKGLRISKSANRTAFSALITSALTFSLSQMNVRSAGQEGSWLQGWSPTITLNGREMPSSATKIHEKALTYICLREPAAKSSPAKFRHLSTHPTLGIA
jgi:hypothetical protein